MPRRQHEPPATRPGRRPAGPGLDIDPDAVRQARLQAGLSLAQVAGWELSRQAVHLIETGKARPRRRTLQIIARRLGVPVSSLLAKTSPSSVTAVVGGE